MKRFVCAAAIILLLLSLASCSEAADNNDTSEYQPYVDSLSAALSGSVPSSIISITEEGGLYSLDVSIGSSGEVSNFGNYVLAVRAAFEEEFPEGNRGSFSLSMSIRGNVPSLIRYSSDDYSDTDVSLSGLLSDNRSGEVVLSKISSLNDLAEHFPAVVIYAEENGYSE